MPKRDDVSVREGRGELGVRRNGILDPLGSFEVRSDFTRSVQRIDGLAIQINRSRSAAANLIDLLVDPRQLAM